MVSLPFDRNHKTETIADSSYAIYISELRKFVRILDPEADEGALFVQKTQKPCSKITDVSTNLANNPISIDIISIAGIGLPKSRVVRVESRNGEIHVVLADQNLNENSKNTITVDETEIRRIMKREVSKPLMLVRSE